MDIVSRGNSDMVQCLSSPFDSPVADQHALHDRLIGTWSVQYTNHPENGSVRHRRGEVRFGWVLDGHAIQDVWIWHPEAAYPVKRIGTTIRFFDPQRGSWRIVWIEPAAGTVVQLAGGEVEGRIVLTGHDADQSQLRWSFNDIRATAFEWRGERSRDGGQTWRMESEYYMQRRLR
jgi:hypothetical protein